MEVKGSSHRAYDDDDDVDDVDDVDDDDDDDDDVPRAMTSPLSASS